MNMKMKMKVVCMCVFVIFATFVASMAQVNPVGERVKNPIEVGADRAKPQRILTLGCCNCLEGSNSLDLSSVPGSGWTINGNPAAFPAIYPGWTTPTGTAKWVSTVTSSQASKGFYEYKLKFVVPNCTISQEVMLSGTFAADNSAQILLDGTQVSACNGIDCFKTAKITPFTATLTPGNHELVVKVYNEGSATGMFLDASLKSKCSNKLTKE